MKPSVYTFHTPLDLSDVMICLKSLHAQIDKHDATFFINSLSAIPVKLNIKGKIVQQENGCEITISVEDGKQSFFQLIKQTDFYFFIIQASIFVFIMGIGFFGKIDLFMMAVFITFSWLFLLAITVGVSSIQVVRSFKKHAVQLQKRLFQLPEDDTPKIDTKIQELINEIGT